MIIPLYEFGAEIGKINSSRSISIIPSRLFILPIILFSFNICPPLSSTVQTTFTETPSAAIRSSLIAFILSLDRIFFLFIFLIPTQKEVCSPSSGKTFPISKILTSSNPKRAAFEQLLSRHFSKRSDNSSLKNAFNVIIGFIRPEFVVYKLAGSFYFRFIFFSAVHIRHFSHFNIFVHLKNIGGKVFHSSSR